MCDYELFNLQDYVQNPIALARIRAHVTQETLASQLNVTQAYISKTEHQENVSPRILNKMLKAIKDCTNTHPD